MEMEMEMEMERKMKKKKGEAEAEAEAEAEVCFDENLLFEVLKHVDARTLAMAGCVNKQWQKTSQDERLWELICTKQWANTGCGEQQLRTVVLALGGFRRLYKLYLFPLSNPHTPPKHLRLGKDELHLSLSLFSTRYFEKMTFNHRTT
ncbi:hypothetical protein Fmac_000445 [Flemingia macrophylla]|uniref:F-box protein GID2 n=1 Tax=Flemingia macrophylla TaxID=520843 RepID=A0ABD1NH30_9FABA